MRNQDVIFVANSPSVDVTKFLNYLNVMLATANNGIVLGTNGIILYNSIKAIGGTGSTTVVTSGTVTTGTPLSLCEVACCLTSASRTKWLSVDLGGDQRQVVAAASSLLLIPMSL